MMNGLTRLAGVTALLVLAACGGSDFECPDGSCNDSCEDDCSFTCDGGSCTQTCVEGWTCDVSCEGGSCDQTCENGATCTLRCEGGSYT